MENANDTELRYQLTRRYILNESRTSVSTKSLKCYSTSKALHETGEKAGKYFKLLMVITNQIQIIFYSC